MSRTPCGVRGLKLIKVQKKKASIKSHPVWGAWIETSVRLKKIAKVGRTPCGVRGLKLTTSG